MSNDHKPLSAAASNRCPRCGGVEPHGMDCPCSAKPTADAEIYLGPLRVRQSANIPQDAILAGTSKENCVMLTNIGHGPTDAAVREAMEFVRGFPHIIGSPSHTALRQRANVLADAAQAPRLTGERLEKMRAALEALDGNWVDDAKALIVAAFPELGEG